jgi:cytidylate kinase
VNKINIAIDGYSSCGKSTLAKALAKELNYVFIDTGAMYRSVALFAKQHGIIEQGIPNKQKLSEVLDQINIHQTAYDGKTETWLNGEKVEHLIRTMEISNLVSEVSKLADVRKKLVVIQQKMGENKGVVMDGRDIGTVVFPNAELKLFMTANHEVRTIRRFNEFKATQPEVSLEAVSENIKARDYKDTHRANDPLRQAEDAIVIDNSELTPAEQLNIALGLIDKVLKVQ